MVHSTLLVLLLLAQLSVLATIRRRRLLRTFPGWALYASIATFHLVVGWLGTEALLVAYPKVLIYLEPLLLVGQIAFTFESALKYSQVQWKGSAIESRLLVWLFVLVPTAILLPIEIGAVQEAASDDNVRSGHALAMLYSLREATSITLFLVLAAVVLAAKVARRHQSPIVRFHHFLLMTYLAGSIVGFGGKQFLPRPDYLITVGCFLVIPILCYALWSWRIWRAKPEDFAANAETDTLDCYPVSQLP